MNNNIKELESLERLVMPDDLFLKECEKLGISNYYDYNFLKEKIIDYTSKEQRIENLVNTYIGASQGLTGSQQGAMAILILGKICEVVGK